MVKAREVIHNYYIDIIKFYPLGSSYPKIGSCYALTFVRMQYSQNKDLVFYNVTTQ